MLRGRCTITPAEGGEGPATYCEERAVCDRCRHLTLVGWGHPSNGGIRYRRASCALAERTVTDMWRPSTDAPDWCPAGETNNG